MVSFSVGDGVTSLISSHTSHLHDTVLLAMEFGSAGIAFYLVIVVSVVPAAEPSVSFYGCTHFRNFVFVYTVCVVHVYFLYHIPSSKTETE